MKSGRLTWRRSAMTLSRTLRPTLCRSRFVELLRRLQERWLRLSTAAHVRRVPDRQGGAPSDTSGACLSKWRTSRRPSRRCPREACSPGCRRKCVNCCPLESAARPVRRPFATKGKRDALNAGVSRRASSLSLSPSLARLRCAKRMRLGIRSRSSRSQTAVSNRSP